MIYVLSYVGMLLLRMSRVRAGYTFLLVVLYFFAAFRFQVGCDWFGYLNQFKLFGGVPYSEAMSTREPLWTMIIRLQSQLGLSYPWLNVISSAIFFFGIHQMAKRQPDRLGFLVLLFPVLILNLPMSGIRQGAAVGIMALAYLAFIDQRLVRFVVLVLAAAGIHSSAVVFLLLAPMVNGGLSRGRIALAVMLAIPGAVALLSTDAVETATSRYVDTGVDAAGGVFRVALSVLTALWFLLFLRRKWLVTSAADYKFAVIGSLMMLSLIVLVAVSSVIGDRLNYYFILIQAMILARLPFLPLRQGKAVAILLPYLGMFMVLVVWTLLSRHFEQCYLPYNTWLFGLPDLN
jgi:hypothetical protein